MWILIIIGAIVLFQLLSKNGAFDGPSVSAEKVCEEHKKRTEELTALIDAYTQTTNHTAEETRAAWEKSQSLLEACGVLKAGAIFQVFCEVRAYLNMQIPTSLDRSNAEELSAFNNAFAKKLLDFYYQVAFTYDLTPDDQAELIRYLRYFLCGPTEYVIPYAVQNNPGYINYQRSLVRIDMDRTEWDVKCLALFEEGCRKNSPLGIRCLADCYYKKIGMDLKDYDKAFALYQRAAQLGDMQAVYMLGQCYENSRGTKTNYQKAGDCYQYAYNISKSQECAKALGRLYDGHRWDKNKYSPDIFNSDTSVMKKANLGKLKLDVERCRHADLDTTDLSVIAASVGMILEEVVNSFVECYESAYLNDNLAEKIKLLRNRGYFTKEVTFQATNIRMLRNRAVHNSAGDPITVDEVKSALRYIKEIVEYYEQF